MKGEERVDPFAALRSALHNISPKPKINSESANPEVRPDPTRWQRSGIPEVVYAEAKPIAAIVDALRALAAMNGRSLASRVRAETSEEIRAALTGEYDVEIDTVARTIVVAKSGCQRQASGGKIGILAAGTSDVPVAREAAVIAREMGAEVITAWDVGVAGLHRLVAPLSHMMTAAVDVVIVAAGMDGALPSVVAGLVPVPVIGLPTSVGYGYGGRGEAALMNMLQSCAPGLVVVNIDNGLGAGATAALIANRVAVARRAGD